MTRDEAIETLEGMIKLGDLYEVDIDACEIAIEALKQEPCEDAISRQAVIRAIYDNTDRLEIAQAVRDLPPVNPQEKTGHWLRTGEVDVYYDLPSYECSECGKTSLENGDYCPNCGARMESGDDK